LMLDNKLENHRKNTVFTVHQVRNRVCNFTAVLLRLKLEKFP
jgi:hypothetical protein